MSGYQDIVQDPSEVEEYSWRRVTMGSGMHEMNVLVTKFIITLPHRRIPHAV
jgi:hypothetical protein